MLTNFLTIKLKLEHYALKWKNGKKKFRKYLGFSNLDIFFVHFRKVESLLGMKKLPFSKNTFHLTENILSNLNLIKIIL